MILIFRPEAADELNDAEFHSPLSLACSQNENQIIKAVQQRNRKPQAA